MKKPPIQLAPLLLAWYEQVHQNRAMPWRQTRDPYAIWLSEIMLQQTQVDTVKPYYSRFLARFPTIASLAAAPLQDVLTLWAGLGYYRRARNLRAAAQQITDKHSGQLPATLESLLSLPGIGRYTAGAIASIAFGIAAPVVDGNVMRVLARLAAYDRDIAVPRHTEFFWELAAEILEGADSGRYGDVNQSLMELGATVCTPAAPRCGDCPVRGFCRAFAEGRTAELPVKSKGGQTAVIRGTAVVILRKGSAEKSEVLLMQRPRGGIWEEMWEFPVLPDAKASAASLHKQIGLKVSTPRRRGRITHQLTHRRMEYDVVVCDVRGRASRPRVPSCPGGGSYAGARWAAWPLEGRNLPIARVVLKIAEAAAGE